MNKRRISRKELGKQLIEEITKDFIRNGHIDPEGKTRDQLHKEAHAIFKNSIKDPDFGFVIDYTDSLVGVAREFKNTDNNELSILLYALFFEHWLNGNIQTFAKRNGLSNEDTIAIIRESRTESKMGWIGRLLGMPPIPENHIKTINQTMAVRNEFVHYKYPPKRGDQQHGLRERSEAVLEKIERTIQYLVALALKNAHGGVREQSP